MSSRKRRQNELEQAFYQVYVRSPRVIKTFTRPLMKTGVRVGRQLRPYTQQARAKADVWIDKNVKDYIGKFISGPKKRAENVASMFRKKK